MTGAAQTLFPSQADGSLVTLDGTVVGSELAGQEFTSPAYFHSRPSATTPADNPSATTFANLGPNTLALKEAVDGYIADALALERPYNPGLRARGPARGHDHHLRLGDRPRTSRSPTPTCRPHRIAAVRGVPLAACSASSTTNTDGRSLGFLGEPGVNVLLLNLDLDRLAGPPPRA